MPSRKPKVSEQEVTQGRGAGPDLEVGLVQMMAEADILIAMTDIDGHVVAWNRALTKLTGCAGADGVGKNMSEWLTGFGVRDLADIMGRVQELQSGARESARALKRLQAGQAGADADAALASARQIGAALCVRRLFDAAGPEYLKAFAERVVSAAGRIVLAADRNGEGFQWIVAHSLGAAPDLSDIVPGLLGIAAAKGGGRGARMQGMGGSGGEAAAFLEAIEKELSQRL